jgi:hypothetical protein
MLRGWLRFYGERAYQIIFSQLNFDASYGLSAYCFPREGDGEGSQHVVVVVVVVVVGGRDKPL